MGAIWGDGMVHGPWEAVDRYGTLVSERDNRMGINVKFSKIMCRHAPPIRNESPLRSRKRKPAFPAQTRKDQAEIESPVTFGIRQRRNAE